MYRCITMYVTTLPVPGKHMVCAPKLYDDSAGKIWRILKLISGGGNAHAPHFSGSSHGRELNSVSEEAVAKFVVVPVQVFQVCQGRTNKVLRVRK